jgi:hypothetical protein
MRPRPESGHPRCKRRAQGMPGARIAPAALRAKVKKHASIVTTGSPKHSGIPCTMVLTVSFALSLVNRAFLPPSPAERLPPTSHQRRDVRTTRLRRPQHIARLRRYRVHRIPRPTSVTIAIRPSSGRGMAQKVKCFAFTPQVRTPAASWHDGQFAHGSDA